MNLDTAHLQSPWRVLIGTLHVKPVPPQQHDPIGSRSSAAAKNNIARGDRTRQKVIRCVSQGEYTIKQVAELCKISESSAKTHLNKLYALDQVTRQKGAHLYYWKAK